MNRARLRRGVQAALFVVFALYLAWPEEMLHAKLFFRADALTVLSGAIAVRAVFFALLFSALLLLITYLMGRVFCGWVCPMGAITDFFDFIIDRKPAAHPLRRVKYHLLIAVGCVSVAGVAVAWVLDPLNWASRIGALTGARLDWSLVAILTALLMIVEVILGRRGFCRVLCPLGALLGCTSSISPFVRRVSKACNGCARCEKDCRMAAIGKDSELYFRAECIHCHDCVVGCPEKALQFKYFDSPLPVRPDPLRRQYLLSLGTGAVLGLAFGRYGRATKRSDYLRPPGSVSEDRFGELCIRCGACIKACPTEGLVAAVDEAGPMLFQTPILVGRKGGCAFDCNACGKVCPTGAIAELPLREKQQVKVGLAAIEEKRCAVFAKKTPCVVCYIACPLSAIELEETEEETEWKEKLSVPRVVKDNCTGCGLCEAACPVSPGGAIKIKA